MFIEMYQAIKAAVPVERKLSHTQILFDKYGRHVCERAFLAERSLQL